MPGHKYDISMDLNFQANTQQAQQQIQKLQQSLNAVINMSSSNQIGIDATKIQEASKAAQELQVHLQNAYNTTTGNFDLGQLNRSLNASNSDINKLSASLLGIGKNGQEAFIQLAQSIANANQPMMKTNALLNDMWTTLKNTARWEISSSILRGFESAISNAYRYAQDLNASLNDIRIVTGYNTDKMAEFAVEANNAAKALSTTTTNYTNASLIYFQQGLSDAEVKERTDVTIKMANVSRESAQTVSDQMTSVWNNFADGSHTLEYYADVMTALGAATASSTAEISQGLEKFSAVAESVGLSYEYATSALATITATTRQSADIVGTALKTLFARIQGLNLGETQDDGTSLNKYSEALYKVGINIKDTNGDMKDMDQILDELGSKWGTLSKDVQIATAQTVAGVRQYTQLIALMDNWDFFQSNLATARGAEGTLNEQAEIYAESWEAARDRVTASLQDIYDSLLDDKFFIGLTNAIAVITDGIGNFIDGLGGAKGVLLLISGILLQTFSNKIPGALKDIKYNLDILTGKANEDVNKIRENINLTIDTTLKDNNISLTSGQKQQLENAQMLNKVNEKYYKILPSLTNEEKLKASTAIEGLKLQQEEVVKLTNQYDALKKKLEEPIQNTNSEKAITNRYNTYVDQLDEELMMRKDSDTRSKIRDRIDFADLTQSSAIDAATNSLNKLKRAYVEVETSKDKATTIDLSYLNIYGDQIKGLTDSLNLDKNKYNLSDLQNAFNQYTESLSPAIKRSEEFIAVQKELNKGNATWDGSKKAISDFIDKLKTGKVKVEDLGKTLKGNISGKEFKDLNDSINKTNESSDRLKNSQQNLQKTIEDVYQSLQHVKAGIENFANIVGGLSTFAMGLTSLKSAFDAIKNPDISGWEKFTTVLMSLSIGLGSVINGLGKLGPLYNSIAISLQGLLVAQQLNTIATEKENLIRLTNIILNKKSIGLKEEQIVLEHASTLAKTLGIKVDVAENAIKAVLNGEMTLEIALKKILLGLDAKRILIYIAMAAAIAAVVGAIVLLVKAYEKWKAAQPEEQLKKLEEETEKSAEAAENAKQAYEDLKDTITNYEDAVKSLEDLTEGTKEFEEALADANAEARDLIEKFGIKGAYIDKQGLIRFPKENFEEALNNSRTNMSATVGYDYYLQNQKQQLQNQINRDQSIETWAKELQDKYGIAYTKLINEYNKLAAQGLSGEDLQKQLITNLRNNTPQAEQRFINAMAEDSDGYFLSSIQGLETQLNNINEASKDTSQALIFAQEAMEDWAVFKNSDYQNILAQFYAKKYIENMDKALSDIEDESVANLQNYLEEKGYTRGSYNTETGETTWTTPQGQEVSFNITDLKNEVAAIRAKIDTEEQVGGDQGTANWINELGKSNPFLASILNAVAGNNANLLSTQEQIALYDLGIKDANSLANRYGMSLDELVANTGISGEAISDFLVNLNPYADLEKAFQTSLKEKISRQEEGIPFEQISIDKTDQDYQNQLNRLKELYKDLPEEDRTILVTAGIDTTQSIEQIKKDIQKVKDEAEIQSILSDTAEATGYSEEAIKAYTEALMANNEALRENELLATKVAETHLIFAKAVEDASDILEDQADVLKEGSKALAKGEEASMEYFDAIGKLTTALNKMFNGKFDSSFLMDEKNLNTFKKAINGNVEAIKTLRKEAAKTIILDLDIDDSYKNELLNLVDDLQSELDSLSVGDSISSDLVDAFNTIIQNAKMTADDVEALFNSLHLEPELKLPEAEIQTFDTNADASAENNVNGTLKFTPDQDGIGQEITYTVSGNINTNANASQNFAIPTLKGATVKSTNKSLGSAAKSNKKKSSSGGSGGSSDKKEPKKATEEIERYHMVTRSLDRLTRALEKVSTAKDRAFGKERLRLIDEEIKATDKLVDKQKEYLYQIQGHLTEDQAALAKYGFTFDEFGEITNYIDVYQQQIAKFNSQLTDAAEEQYNEFVKATEQYEETLTLLDEQQMQLQEYLNQLVDLKLEKITTEVEVKIRVNDVELTKLEYFLKKLQREGAAAADEIANIAKQIEQVMEKATPIQEAIDKIYEQARAEGRGLNAAETAEIQSFYNDGIIDELEQARMNEIFALADAEDRMLTQAEEDQIQEYKEQLLELNETVWELADSIENKLGEKLEELNGEVQDSINRFSTYTSIFENLKNILTLTNKANTLEGIRTLNQLSASMLKNATSALKANVANYEVFQDLRDAAEEQLASAIAIGDKHMIEYWEDQLTDVTKQMEEAHQNMLASFGDALEAAGDLFDTKVNSMITKLKKNLGDLDTIIDMYDRAKELEELYLSNNQSIYELSKLARDIGKSIDDTTNLIAKNKLGELMKEINSLRAQGVQLSKYDLEYLQAKYNLEVAEIALQEAQEAKSQVKLTRNTEGAWGYVYTADMGKVSEAEQNYEDAMYNMQSLNENYIADYSERLLQNRQAMIEALANIDKTREDYDAEVIRVKEAYMEKEKFYVEELTKAYERSGIQYQDTILGMVSNDESLLESHQNFVEQTETMIYDELFPAYEEWLENTQNICEEAGYSYEELTSGILESISDVDEASSILEENVLNENENMRESMKETMQEIKNWQAQYLETINQMIAANEAYYDKTIADYSNAMEKIIDTAQYALDTIVNAAQSAAAAVATAFDNIPNHEDPSPPPEENGKIMYGGANFRGITQYNKVQFFSDFQGNYLYDADPIKSQIKKWNLKQLKTFATGGYTNAWGPEGKLAVLHEKELVLNKQDTSNILSAVDIVRRLNDSISDLWIGRNHLSSDLIFPTNYNGDTLQQDVHIEASFPNVSDRNEIEEAFNNLINTASQYSNRKRI